MALSSSRPSCRPQPLLHWHSRPHQPSTDSPQRLLLCQCLTSHRLSKITVISPPPKKITYLVCLSIAQLHFSHTAQTFNIAASFPHSWNPPPRWDLWGSLSSLQFPLPPSHWAFPWALLQLPASSHVHKGFLVISLTLDLHMCSYVCLKGSLLTLDTCYHLFVPWVSPLRLGKVLLLFGFISYQTIHHTILLLITQWPSTYLRIQFTRIEAAPSCLLLNSRVQYNMGHQMVLNNDTLVTNKPPEDTNISLLSPPSYCKVNNTNVWKLTVLRWSHNEKSRWHRLVLVGLGVTFKGLLWIHEMFVSRAIS